jgi:Protein of unknown function (DUF732)
MNVAPGKWSTVCAVLLSAAALLTAAPASADRTDDAFVAALARGGISMPDRNSAIAMAQAVCAGLDTNEPSSVLAVKLARDADLSPRQSGYFIGASVGAYCPENKGKLDGSLNWLNPGPPLM